MSVDPVVSVALGDFAFDGSLHDTFIGRAVALAGFAVMIVGVVVLSSSQSSKETSKVGPDQGSGGGLGPAR
jgi:hypothetical protein